MSNGTKDHVLMTPAHSSMKDLLPRKIKRQIPHRDRCNRGSDCCFSHQGKQSKSPRANDDDLWHVYEENLKIDPPVEDLQKEMDIHEVVAIIFSKKPTALRNKVDEPADEEIPAGDVEVINPITGNTENIRSDDPSYYGGSGFKAHKNKNSSKPKEIPPFVWKSMSQKDRRNAIAEEQKTLALEEKEKKRARRVKSLPSLGVLKCTPNDVEDRMAFDFIPAMPVCQMNPKKHRVKCVRLEIRTGERTINTLVARPVVKKEIRANPKAQQALDIECDNLVKNNVRTQRKHAEGMESDSFQD